MAPSSKLVGGCSEARVEARPKLGLKPGRSSGLTSDVEDDLGDGRLLHDGVGGGAGRHHGVVGGGGGEGGGGG